MEENGCNWKLKARKRSVHDHFEIMESLGPHTCMNPSITQDHSNLKSSDIAEAIRAQIIADPNIKEKVLLATAENLFGYHPNRKKIRNAKKIVMEDVHGSWEGSYSGLPYLMEMLQCFNNGTKVDWLFKKDEMRERLFWALKPCIDGFEHCIPVILIDWTHLYGPYPGVLLSATSVDGFSHLLPLAFAIVEAENMSSWGWFMDRLRRFVAGTSLQTFEQLVAAEPMTTEWFEDKPLKKWSLAHDGGKRFGIMTTNHAESWNNAIIEAQNLPITSLVRALFEKLVDYFDARRVEIATQTLNGQIFTKVANMKLIRAISRASGHHVKLFDRDTWLFQVTTKRDGLKGGNNHTIRIHEQTCTCGKWQNYHIPCSHVIACCAHVKMTHDKLVDDCYKLENISKIYNGVFEPIPNKGDPRWPTQLNFPKVIHDEGVQKKKGRRKSTRFKNEMNFQEPRGKKSNSTP
ncbi:uncharacterized protein LOC141718204 [Apium graveolens]|uniref:uncharacterized protein LOC141718204 n=1 Tax=Apium graveolens TaxID=4045 RepID=UPI003D79EF21